MGDVAICSHCAGPGGRPPWNPPMASGPVPSSLGLGPAGPGGRPPWNPPMASGPVPSSLGLGPAGRGPAGPGWAAADGSRQAAISGGTASTTPSARITSPSPLPPAVPRLARRTRNPPEGSASTAAALAPSRTRARSRPSRLAAACPCRSPSGTAGIPMSAASRPDSRAVFTTVAASARFASSPATLSADTVNRSHSARRACSPCPWAASQSPRRCPSSPGLAGSSRVMARAAGTTRSRSA